MHLRSVYLQAGYFGDTINRDITHEYHRLYVTALIEGLHLHEAIIRSDLTAVEGILKARVDVNLKYKVRLPRVFHALWVLS